jgi:RNA polymerase sigma-54 factor
MKPRNQTSITTTQRLKLTLGLAASIRLLRQDASGLAMYLEEQAAENPHLRLSDTAADPGDWLPRWHGTFAPGSGIDHAPAAGPSLMGHVMAHLDRLFPAGTQRRVALVIAQAVEPSGWLGRPLAELAREAGVDLHHARGVLRQLQGIDPAGLFAQNLTECLELQLAEAGWLDDPMRKILSRLDLLAAGDVARLARLAGIDAAGVALRQRRIRSLNPKPGTLFEEGAAPVREPDLTLSREGGRWIVALNRSALPGVAVDAAAQGGSAERLAAAREILRQVQSRGATILTVAQEVFRRQSAALDHGMTALRPMTLADIAAALGLNVSTVSRAVSGTSVDTPSGTFWLRSYFSQGLRQRGEGEDRGTSATALRAEIVRLVSTEDRTAPLSDEAIADALAAAFGGSAPARRTVAKYRALLAIPPCRSRRSAAAAGPGGQAGTATVSQPSSTPLA